jgi:hypothetical protein
MRRLPTISLDSVKFVQVLGLGCRPNSPMPFARPLRNTAALMRGQVPLDRAKAGKFFTALSWMSRDFADWRA